MEETLLGGRLRHRHVQGAEFFQVIINVRVLALCPLTFVLLQLETLILVVNESGQPRETWLSDEYVEKLIGLLQTG